MKFELDPFHRNVSEAELIRDLREAESILRQAGRRLTFRTYREAGKYSPHTANSKFGSWNNALRAAGLSPVAEKNVSVTALFDNIKTVWIAKGRQPNYRDMAADPSQFAGSTYNARFGGWRKALEAFVEASSGEEFDVASALIELENAFRSGRSPSLSLRYKILKRDNFRCVLCGRSPATTCGLVLEIDHSTAWTNGGATSEENLMTLCFDCNRGKGAT